MGTEGTGENSRPEVDPTMRAMALAMAAQEDKGLGDFVDEVFEDARQRAHMGTFRRLGDRIVTLLRTNGEKEK